MASRDYKPWRVLSQEAVEANPWLSQWHPVSPVTSSSLSTKQLPTSQSISMSLTTIPIQAPTTKPPLAALGTSQSSYTTLAKLSAPKLPGFRKSSKLPLELRLIIWREAGSVCQVVGACVTLHRGKAALKGREARCLLLLACKESRNEVMKMKGNFGASDPRAPKIYVNFDVDMILPQDYAYGHSSNLQALDEIFELICAGGNRRRVWKVAIDSRLFNRRDRLQLIYTMRWLFQMELKELILVLGYEKTSLSFRLRAGLLDPHQSFAHYAANMPLDEKNEVVAG